MTLGGEIGTALWGVLAGVDRALVHAHAAGQAARDSADLIAAVGQGSYQSDYEHAAGYLSQAAADAEQVRAWLMAARDAVARYLNHLIGLGVVSAEGPASTPAATPAAAGTAPPPVADLPVLTSEHGQLPGAAGSAWLYVKLFLPAQRVDHLLVHALPELLTALAGRAWWFVRYPQARDVDEPDHLRLRVRVHGDRPGDTEQALAAVTTWAARLRADGLIGRLAVDTYFPEVGRYRAMPQAEDVFAADSELVLAHLTHVANTTGGPAPTVLTGLSLFDLATAFLGDRRTAADWLATRTRGALAGRPAPERDEVTAITRLARAHRHTRASGWSAMGDAHAHRDLALAHYRAALPTSLDTEALDQVLHSLLHMHHNRALGVDRDREAVCLRLARHAAAAWRAAQEPT